MKAMLTVLIFLISFSFAFSQKSELKEINEKFRNGESVWQVIYNGSVVGEFWPIRGLNLITNQTNPELFIDNVSLDIIHKKFGGIAMSPDGMTKASVSGYVMEGKSLANGIPCGDGNIYNYGIVVVDKGFNITFTHNLEINDFDSYYQNCLERKATLFFLPSIYRNGKSLVGVSSGSLDKVLIRRETKLKSNNWEQEVQIGVILFNKILSYQQIQEIILGLERNLSYAQSKTTHIYALDGGGAWGQSCKEVNGVVRLLGTRDPSVVTNYLVFY